MEVQVQYKLDGKRAFHQPGEGEVTIARRMADEAFRKEQEQHRYDDHIAPINRLVDALRESGGRWLPYVAPMYGGVSARLLSLLRDPGPMTQSHKGSGFLSMENDDATAEAISQYFAAAGIGAIDIVPWNVYPWYINRAPKASELNDGIEPLRRVIGLLPHLRVVMLHGGSAVDGWKRFARQHQSPVTALGLVVIETYHTSRQAFWHSDPSVRESRREHLRGAFTEAARVLAGGRAPSV
jgi:hypothetical protein